MFLFAKARRQVGDLKLRGQFGFGRECSRIREYP